MTNVMAIVVLLSQASITQAPNQAPRRYLNTGFRIQNADVQKFVNRLAWIGIELPFEVQGNATVSVQIGVPVGALRDAKAYRASGTISSDQLRVAGIDIRKLSADLSYAEGILRLDKMRFETPDPAIPAGAVASNGVFSGSAEIALIPRGNLTAHLAVERASLALVPGLPADLRGLAGGDLRMTAPADRLTSPEAWVVTGELLLGKATILGARLDEARTGVTLQEGKLSLSDLRGQVENAMVTGSGDLLLAAPHAFTARVRVSEKGLETIKRLAPPLAAIAPLRGNYEITANADGTVAPLKWSASGNGTASELLIEDVAIASLTFGYLLDNERARLTEFVAALFGGQMEGLAETSLNGTTPSILDVRMTGIEAAAALARFAPPQLPPWNARLSGSLKVTLPAGAALQDAAAAGNLDATALQVGNQADAGAIRAQFDYLKRSLSARWEGTLFAGSVRGSAMIPIDGAADRVVSATWQNVQLGQAPRFSIGPIDSIDGTVTGSLDARLAAGEKELRNASVKGAIEGVDLQVNEVAFGLFRGDVEYRERILSAQWSGQAFQGELNGSARLPLGMDRAGDGEIHTRLTQVALGPATSALGQGQYDVEGMASGSLDATLAGGSWEGDALALKASLEIVNAQIREIALGQLKVNAEYSKQLLQSDLAGSLFDGKFAGSVRLPTDGAADATVSFDLKKLRLDLVQAALLPGNDPWSGLVSGSLSATLPAEGELRDDLTATMTWQVSEAQINQAKLGEFKGDLKYAEQRLRSSLAGSVFSGQLTGQANVSFAGQDSTLELGLEGLSLEELREALLKDGPLLAGSVAGSVSMTIPDGPTAIHASTGKATLGVTELTVNRVLVGGLKANVEYREQSFGYLVTGDLYGGRLRVEGKTASRTKADSEGSGSLRVEGLRIGRALDTLTSRRTNGSLTGVLDLSADYRHPKGDWRPEGEGTVSLSAARWNGRLLLDGTRGRVRLLDDRLIVSDVGGTLAGGRLRAGLVFFWMDPGRSNFRLAVSGARPSVALGAWPELATSVDGPVDVQLRGSLGRRWQGNGSVGLRRGTVAGLRVSSGRLPITWTYSPTTQRGELRVRGGTAGAGLGRVTGNALVGWNASSVNVDGDLNLANLDAPTVVRIFSTTEQISQGKINGKITFAGRDVRSENDLQGSVDLSLHQAQANSLPVLRNITSFVSMGSSGFSTGELKATFSGGVIRLRHATLQGDRFDLYADGVLTMAGRLDLSVTVSNGVTTQQRNLIETVLLRLPAFGPMPIALALRANEFLSNRVIHLRVTGTARAPVIRVQPLPLLQDEAIRFFLRPPAI